MKGQRTAAVYRWLGGGVIALFAVFYLYPVASTLLLSVRPEGGGLSLIRYAEVLGDGFYRSVILRTLVIAAESTLVTMILGYGLALFIATRERGRGVWLSLIVVPMFMSLLIRLYGWMILLSNGGAVNDVLTSLGIIDEPLALLFARPAVVLGIVHYCLPFMVLTSYSSLKRIDPALQQAAYTLGASRWRVFRTVTLPLSLPGLVAGTSLVFALASSTFIVPLMIGGARDRMLANYVYLAVNDMGDWPLAAVLAFLLLVLVVAILAAANRVARSTPAVRRGA